MDQWYKQPWQKVLESLNIDKSIGLSEEEVNRSKAIFGDNTLVSPERNKLSKIIFEYVNAFWSYYYLLVILLLIISGSIFISLFAIILYIITIYLLVNEDIKYNQTLNVFEKINTQQVMVIRDRRTLRVPSEELVVGDLVFLEAGEIVPADIRLIECKDLMLREGAITGEETLSEKFSSKIDYDVYSISDIKNMLFKASIIHSGECFGVVVSAGVNSVIGKILSTINESNKHKEEFKHNISNMMNKLAVLSFMFVIILAFLDYVINKEFSFSAVKVSPIFPFNLLLILLVYWKRVLTSFNEKGLDLKHISTITKLSTVSLVLVDKVGAFTEKDYFVNKLYSDFQIYETNINLPEEYNLKRLIETSVLASNYKPNKETSLYSNSEVIDKALYVFGKQKIGNSFERCERVFSIHYDNDRKVSSSINKYENFWRVNVMGGVDSVLEKCTHILKNGLEVEISDKDVVRVKDGDFELAKGGSEVMAFAFRTFNYEPSQDENVESNLVFVGLIGLENPIRESSYDIINYARTANIRTLISSEDNKLASFNFGKELGIVYNDDRVISGVELDNMSEDHFSSVIEKVLIFSRINFWTKLRIVKKLSGLGEGIAVTGSKLIDIPYMKEAHLSIAVGDKSSSMCKKMSDVFIKENNIYKIIDLVLSSRKILSLIQRIFYYNFIALVVQGIFMLITMLLFNESILNAEMVFITNAVAVPLFTIIPIARMKKIKIKNYKNYWNEMSFANYKLKHMVFLFIIVGFLYFSILFFIKEYINLLIITLFNLSMLLVFLSSVEETEQ
ncbi:MAG: cation-transporting P-type ATPase [Clostridiaceae bacterium]